MRFVLRLVLLGAGLVFAASLAVAAAVLLLFGGVRALWARLTGRPVSPFGMRIDPRGGFARVYRSGPAGGRRQPVPRDVTDVEVREVRPPAP